MASAVRRSVAAGLIVAGVVAWMGHGLPVASASTSTIAAFPDRLVGDAPAEAAAVILTRKPDTTPARTAPRRPRPPAAIVASVPFVCSVHLAEGGDASDASD